MFSEISHPSWDASVQRPTVDPDTETTRDDTVLLFLAGLVILYGCFSLFLPQLSILAVRPQ